MIKWLLVVLFVVTLATRFYNLERTARFVWDESSDLVSTVKLLKRPRLTLIGPISEDRIKVFSSLTYYLFLPFVLIFGQNPLSPVLSSAFFGCLTVVLFWQLLHQLKVKPPLAYALPVFFYPLLITSRWAWNPNFIPFWSALALLCLLSDLKFKYPLTGIFLGLTIHQHWYAVFTVIGFGLIVYYLGRNLKSVFGFFMGIFVSILPFIVFDLTHPPGLFLSRMLYFSRPAAAGQPGLLTKIISVPVNVLGYFLGNPPSWLSLAVLSLLILLTIKRITAKNYLLIPLFFQIIGLILIRGPVFDHYYLAAAIPFLLWLAINFKLLPVKLTCLIIFILFTLRFDQLFFRTGWDNNIAAISEISDYISANQKDSANFNLAVIGSPDPNTKGLRYRDLLYLKEQNPREVGDYNNLKSFYVISATDNWQALKADPAFEMDLVRRRVPSEIYTVPSSIWTVYRFSL